MQFYLPDSFLKSLTFVLFFFFFLFSWRNNSLRQNWQELIHVYLLPPLVLTFCAPLSFESNLIKTLGLEKFQTTSSGHARVMFPMWASATYGLYEGTRLFSNCNQDSREKSKENVENHVSMCSKSRDDHSCNYNGISSSKFQIYFLVFSFFFCRANSMVINLFTVVIHSLVASLIKIFDLFLAL